MRRAAKVDANQKEIIEAFRSMGASVWVIKEPVDLLIGYSGRTCAVEVKNLSSSRGKILTRQQIEFFAEFKGMSAKVETLEDCRLLLARMAK